MNDHFDFFKLHYQGKAYSFSANVIVTRFKYPRSIIQNDKKITRDVAFLSLLKITKEMLIGSKHGGGNEGMF